MNGYYREYDEGVGDEGTDEREETYYEGSEEAVQRPRRINPGPIGRGVNYYTPQLGPNVGQQQFQSALRKAELDVSSTKRAVERVARQANSANAQLARRDARQAKDIARLKTDDKGQAVLTALALLLQRPGKLIDTTTGQPPGDNIPTGNLAVTPPDNTLPVIAAAFIASGGFGGGTSGYDVNSLLSNPVLLLAGFIVLRDLQGNPLFN